MATGQYAPAYCRVRVPAWSLRLIKDALHSLCFHYMFITLPVRTSAAVQKLLVDFFNGVVFCELTNGLAYEYTNVSRRVIIILMLHPNLSLGFWVNKNLVNTILTPVIESGLMTHIYCSSPLGIAPYR